jgi:hypothetical protein
MTRARAYCEQNRDRRRVGCVGDDPRHYGVAVRGAPKGAAVALLQALFLAPLIFPAIVLGLSLLLFCKLIG